MSNFGFVWGQMGIERTTTLPDGRRVLTIKTNTQALTVIVSPNGDRITTVGPLRCSSRGAASKTYAGRFL